MDCASTTRRGLCCTGAANCIVQSERSGCCLVVLREICRMSPPQRSLRSSLSQNARHDPVESAAWLGLNLFKALGRNTLVALPLQNLTISGSLSEWESNLETAISNIVSLVHRGIRRDELATLVSEHVRTTRERSEQGCDRGSELLVQTLDDLRSSLLSGDRFTGRLVCPSVPSNTAKSGRSE